MSNFSEYINNNSTKDENKKQENISKEDLQTKIDKYSSYSQDKLLSEFIKLTIEKKKKGELTDTELNSLKNTITPMLNQEQKKTLENLLKLVKDVK